MGTKRKSVFALAVLAPSLVISACSASLPPVKPVEYVDLERFMGDWYVIASIPTFIEKDAYNAIESYALNDDASIATTFVYREGSFVGKEKHYHPTAFVTDRASNAVWGMQFIWPIKADYRIAYLDEDYSRTVIARNKRDFVWVMARTPSISGEAYAELETLIGSLGYDTSELRKVPQRW